MMYNYFNYRLRYTTPMRVKKIKRKSNPNWVLTDNMKKYEYIMLPDVISMEKWMIFMDIK